jgi:hypothetical protein
MSTTNSSKQNPMNPSANETYPLSLLPSSCQLDNNPNDDQQSDFSAKDLDWNVEDYYRRQGRQAGFEDTNPSC